MNDQDLRRLFDLLVTTREYDEGVCPDDTLITGMVAGVLDPRTAARVSRHVSSCEPCRALTQQLSADAGWFLSRKDRIMRGLTAWAASEGLEPWRSCPSAEAMDAIAAERVADDPGRSLLLERFGEHVRGCAECRAAWEGRRSGGKSTTIEVDRPWTAFAAPRQAALRAILTTLQEVSASAGPARRPGTGPGRVFATLFDAAGRLRATDDGRPRTHELRLVRADIDTTGRLTVELAADSAVAQPDLFKYDYTLLIDYNRWAISLKGRGSQAAGTLSYAAELPPGVPVPFIPWWMIRLAGVSMTA